MASTAPADVRASSHLRKPNLLCCFTHVPIGHSTPWLQDIIASWYEQRAWSFDYPMQALPDGHPLKAQLEEMFAQVYPPAQQPTPTASGWSVAAAGHVYSVGPYNVAFDAASGAISHLASAASGQAWATGNPGELLGVLEYQTYDQSTYDTFIANYYCCPGSGPAPSWVSTGARWVRTHAQRIKRPSALPPGRCS